MMDGRCLFVRDGARTIPGAQAEVVMFDIGSPTWGPLTSLRLYNKPSAAPSAEKPQGTGEHCSDTLRSSGVNQFTLKASKF